MVRKESEFYIKKEPALLLYEYIYVNELEAVLGKFNDQVIK